MIRLPLNSSSMGYCTIVEEVVGIYGVILGLVFIEGVFGRSESG